MPSSFLSQKKYSSKKKERIFTYDRDIICLPKSYGKGSSIPVPRSRNVLASNGLIGKIRVTSEMSESEIFDEIRSVFSQPMNGDPNFRFDVLQSAGGRCKSLVVPSTSESFQWTASAIAPKNTKMPIYIIAREQLTLVML